MNALAQLMAIAELPQTDTNMFAGVCADCGRHMYDHNKSGERPTGWVAKCSAIKCFTCHRKNPVYRVLKPSCDVCGSMLRASNEPSSPGVRLRHGDGICTACEKRIRKGPSKEARKAAQDAMYAEIVRLRTEGLQRAEIAKRVGRSLALVGRVLASAGVTKKGSGRRRGLDNCVECGCLMCTQSDKQSPGVRRGTRELCKNCYDRERYARRCA